MNKEDRVKLNKWFRENIVCLRKPCETCDSLKKEWKELLNSLNAKSKTRKKG